MARIKLVYLGGGSTRAAGTMASFMANGADFDGSEVVLVDLDDDRLALIRTLAEKMARLAERLVDRLWDEDLIDFKMQERDLRHQVTQVIEEDLRIEDEIANEAIERIQTYKRDIPYGSDEWRILYDRFFAEIALRRGYTL